jgi:hypothetical protein
MTAPPVKSRGTQDSSHNTGGKVEAI